MRQIKKKKSSTRHISIPKLLRKDLLNKPIHIGDWVRLMKIPPSIIDMPYETRYIFKKALRKTFRIDSFNQYNLAELDLSKKVARNNSIWVEPEYLLLYRRKRVK